jgi:hypothetical protein
MTWGMTAVGGSALLTGFMGANAAKDAARTQAAAADRAAQMQMDMFNTQNEQQKPYREAGYTALKDIAGSKDYFTKQYGPEDFAAGLDPSYAFRLKQGQMATDAALNRAGGLVGGNAMQGMQDYTQGLASTEYGNAFNRYQTQRGNIYNTLASIAGLGQTSLGQTTQAGTTAAGNIGQAMIGSGTAQAAGTIGAANAIGAGLQGAGNTYMMSQLLKPGGTALKAATYVPTSNFDFKPDYSLNDGQIFKFNAS